MQTIPKRAEHELLSREEAARMLGIKASTLQAWYSTGRHDLAVLKVGRLVRYRVSDVQRWLEGRTATSVAIAAENDQTL